MRLARLSVQGGKGSSSGKLASFIHSVGGAAGSSKLGEGVGIGVGRGFSTNLVNIRNKIKD